MINLNDLKIGITYKIYQNNNWVIKTINNQQHLNYLLFDSRGINESLKTINRIIKL